MKTQTYAGAVMLIAIGILSCSAPKKTVVQEPTVIIEKERVISKPFEVVWQSAIEWFATHNTPIKNLDKSSGLISTEYSVPIGDAYRYMSCAAASSNFAGKTEIANRTGNFNVLIKKLGDNSTKISVNVFFGCTINKYKYKSVISTEYVLESSTRADCSSRGALEREILNYLEASGN